MKVTIITCFSYAGNSKYHFNPDYLRSDLRRILAFSQNRTGVRLQDTYVLTDIQPSLSVIEEYLSEFHEETYAVLIEKGYPSRRVARAFDNARKHRCKPLIWLQAVCKELDPSTSHLSKSIERSLLSIIRTQNVIEFAYLFTNFFMVFGANQFEGTLSRILTERYSKLLFYYTGHGIRSINGISLLIPRGSEVDFLSNVKLQEVFRAVALRDRLSAFIILDCCHAQSLLPLPEYKTLSRSESDRNQSEIDFINEIVTVSSTRDHQTCGFLSEKGATGSIFSYFLMKHLNSIAQEVERGHEDLRLSRLRNGVEKRVTEYRNRMGKPPQNAALGLNDSRIRCLPRWLFEESYKRSEQRVINHSG